MTTPASPTTPQPATDREAPPPAGRQPVGILREALALGLIGGGLLAAIETGGVALVSARHFTEGWPWGLILAGFGKAALTHLLFWTPLLLLLGLLLCRGRYASGPERLALLTGLYFAMTLPVVLMADLLMLNRDAPWQLALAGLGGLLFGLLAWFVQSRTTRRMSPRLVRAALVTKTVVFGAALLVGLVSLVGSPFWNPGAYRIATHLPGPAAAQRNILWIVLDTVRADRLGIYGHERATTPALAARADRLQVFERVVTPGIWTVPGHASMFTGLSTREHGADLPGRWLDDEKTTIAERLTGMGYATAGFTNNPWVSPHTNLSRGMTYYLGLNHYRHLGRFSLEFLCDWFGIAPPVPWLDGDYGAAATNLLVRDWLAARSPEQPFFVFVNYMEGHAPYRVPRTSRARFMDDRQVARSYALRKSLYGEIADVLHYTFNIEGADFLSAGDREILSRQYDAGIRYLDMRVAELLDLLDDSGLTDDTLVIITADHGEYLDEHGMWGHTFLAYEGVTRVPLLLQVPGQPGRRRMELARLADLFPTVLHFAAGRPQTGPGAGTRSLLDEPGADTGRLAITRWSGAEPRLQKRIDRLDDPEVRHRGTGQTAIQDGRWKLMVSDAGRRELYDLERDPAERVNLLTSVPDEAARLAEALADWERRVPLYRSQRARPGKQDADLLRDLEALGYAGGDDEEDDDPPPAASQPRPAPRDEDGG